MDAVEQTVSHMREKQLHWQNYADMRQMTVSQMMALERWLQCAEVAPESVSVGKA